MNWKAIHFDMPFSPNRMEQRIGRLDRIGRTKPVRSTIFIGPACEQSIFEAWYRVLNEGFRAFDTSIASLQFYVDAVLPRLTEAVLTSGAQGLLEQLDAVRKGIAEEEERISEQDALDALDASEQEAASCFQSIQELEASYQELEDDFHAWAGEALLFRRDPDFYRTEGLVLYTPAIDRWGQSRTLVPSDWLEHRLKKHLEYPGTFERAKALKNQGATLLRIGEGLIDTMAGYVRWDDQGQAFALWRWEPTWDAAVGAGKDTMTFSDAITAVRRWRWADWVFATGGHDKALCVNRSPYAGLCVVFPLAWHPLAFAHASPLHAVADSGEIEKPTGFARTQ